MSICFGLSFKTRVPCFSNSIGLGILIFFSNLAIVYVSAKNLISKLQEPLEFNASELQKHFKMGDHVKVISGRYDGDTGLIVRVNANFVVLFSDLTMHEVFWHFLNLY